MFFCASDYSTLVSISVSLSLSYGLINIPEKISLSKSQNITTCIVCSALLGDMTGKRVRLLQSIYYHCGVTGPWCVCLSVCHVLALCSNGIRYRQDFVCIRQFLVSLSLSLPPTTPFPGMGVPNAHTRGNFATRCHLANRPIIEKRYRFMLNYFRP